MQTNIFNLQGKKILITGASSGLGKHFAKIFSAAGAEVVIGARRIDNLNTIAEEIKQTGAKISCIKLDVTSTESIKNVFSAHPDIDVLVNNAGVFTQGSPISLTEEDWDFTINTNLKAVWMLSKEASKLWIDQNKPGNIINVSSVLGLRVASQLSFYNTSKAGVVQLTKSMALDLAKNNIRVNSIAPGYFLTEMTEDILNSEAGKQQIKRIPFKRMGNMDELTGPMLLLASDASSYMSGSVLVVDGAHLCSTM